jgi:hypothetical protein
MKGYIYNNEVTNKEKTQNCITGTIFLVTVMKDMEPKKKKKFLHHKKTSNCDLQNG